MTWGNGASANRIDRGAFEVSLGAAREGEAERLGPLLEQYRGYLLSIARQESPLELVAKLGASDLVQDTLVRGIEHFASFDGATHEQLARWLRQILLNHVRNIAKSYGTDKRDVVREQAIDRPLMARREDSPSRKLMSREREEQLQRALDRLPEELRRVIELRHRENLPFAAIAGRLDKSEDTARRIWARAIAQLQGELQHGESSAG
jgi:RNA polymerase sigma-70 factor (ECF subfamily)